MVEYPRLAAMLEELKTALSFEVLIYIEGYLVSAPLFFGTIYNNSC
jgi:hypothetical protein